MINRIDDQVGPSGDVPLIVGLGDPLAARRGWVGDAAAQLAGARALGLPVPDGFVVTTRGVGLIAEKTRRVVPALRLAWQDVQGPVLLRMSSCAEPAEARGGGPEYVDATTWKGMLDGMSDVLLHDRMENPGRSPESWGLLVLRRPLILRSVLVTTGNPFGSANEISFWFAEDDPEVGGARLTWRDRRTLRRLAHRARAGTGRPVDIEVVFDLRNRPWIVDLRTYQEPPW